MPALLYLLVLEIHALGPPHIHTPPFLPPLLSTVDQIVHNVKAN